MAGAIGVGLAFWIVPVIRAAVPEDIAKWIAGWQAIEVDGTIAIVGACMTVGAGLTLGLVTGGHAARAGDAGVHGARGAIEGPGLWRHVIVGAQVCFAVLLLAGAAIALRGFREVSDAFASLRPAQLLAFDIRLPAWRYSDDRRVVDFVDRLLAAMRTMPEIQSAGLIRNPPASNVPSPLTPFVVGRDAAPPPSDAPRAEVQIVTPDAFRTLDLAIVSGRGVTGEDAPDSPRVAVISHTMARRFWGDRDPLGAGATATIALLAFVVAIAASLGPALRAALSDPSRLLQAE
jgi:putative ABC transport system permease protein